MSTAVSARSRRPSNSVFETKSIDHISFGAAAAGCRTRSAALMLRLGFLSRRLSPTCQVRDQLLELAVLILEQLQPTQLSHAEPGLQRLPSIEGLLGNPAIERGLSSR